VPHAKLKGLEPKNQGVGLSCFFLLSASFSPNKLFFVYLLSPSQNFCGILGKGEDEKASEQLTLHSPPPQLHTQVTSSCITVKDFPTKGMQLVAGSAYTFFPQC